MAMTARETDAPNASRLDGCGSGSHRRATRVCLLVPQRDRAEGFIMQALLLRGSASIAAFKHAAERHNRRTKRSRPLAKCRSQHHPERVADSPPAPPREREDATVSSRPTGLLGSRRTAGRRREGVERVTRGANQHWTVPADE